MSWLYCCLIAYYQRERESYHYQIQKNNELDNINTNQRVVPEKCCLIEPCVC